jgi:site-specific recombinase XerC
LQAKIDKLGKVRNQLTQERQAHQKTKQTYRQQLNQILKMLGTTTNLTPLTSPSDNNTLANLVQEQVAVSQAEKENRGREIEQLKEEIQQLKNDRAEQAKI